MLGKHASGLYWMFRHLERSENTARLIEAGFRLALTRAADGEADSHEEQLIRRVSELLYVSHGDFIRAKLAALGE